MSKKVFRVGELSQTCEKSGFKSIELPIPSAPLPPVEVALLRL